MQSKLFQVRKSFQVLAILMSLQVKKMDHLQKGIVTLFVQDFLLVGNNSDNLSPKSCDKDEKSLLRKSSR